jgi:hypothetical protein
LGSFQGLTHDSLGGFVVANLGVPGKREVLASGVTFEAIIGQDTSKIGVSLESNAEHIKAFTFTPSGGGIQGGQGWNQSGFIQT